MPFYTTLIPLLGVLLVTAIKDAFDDIVSLFPSHFSLHDSNIKTCYYRNAISVITRLIIVLHTYWNQVVKGKNNFTDIRSGNSLSAHPCTVQLI